MESLEYRHVMESLLAGFDILINVLGYCLRIRYRSQCIDGRLRWSKTDCRVYSMGKLWSTSQTLYGKSAGRMLENAGRKTICLNTRLPSDEEKMIKNVPWLLNYNFALFCIFFNTCSSLNDNMIFCALVMFAIRRYSLDLYMLTISFEWVPWIFLA